MRARPPHILFLMDDQHRFDVAGFMGNRVVRTPNLDALADDAAVFDAAYTPSPVCIPGRQCLMSGQLPTTNGCRRFGDDLEPFAETFAARLARVGYRTACAGKLHHTGPDQMQGWTDRIGMETEVNPAKLSPEAAEAAAAYNADREPMWSLQKELTVAGGGRNPYAVYDDYSIEGARHFLDRHFCDPLYDRHDHRPLLLKVSLQQPHYPFICSPALFRYYLDRVETYPDSAVVDHWWARDWTWHPDVSPREMRRALAAYYGMVEEVDRGFGQILDHLRELGQNLDDWLIIFTSDHGDMLGEHGTWWKLKFYEGSVRVPLFIRAPRLTGGARRIDRNVSLCDLYATLCEVADAELPPARDSRSLLPLLRGETATWDNEAVSIYDDHVMIRRDQWKYWNLMGEPRREVLFNLAADPGETHDCLSEHAEGPMVAAFRERTAALLGASILPGAKP